jgi:hypothetical protein
MSRRLFVGASVGTAVFGFFAGLLLFKVKSRWCPTCGDSLQCLACRSRARFGGRLK